MCAPVRSSAITQSGGKFHDKMEDEAELQALPPYEAVLRSQAIAQVGSRGTGRGARRRKLSELICIIFTNCKESWIT